jgi:hypothetical protein
MSSKFDFRGLPGLELELRRTVILPVFWQDRLIVRPMILVLMHPVTSANLASLCASSRH